MAARRRRPGPRPIDDPQGFAEIAVPPPAADRQAIGEYSVHVRTRKFRNPEKTKRYVVPAPRANSKTQGGTRIDSDSICHRCHRHQSVFFGFSDGLSRYIFTHRLLMEYFATLEPIEQSRQAKAE